MFSLWIFVIVLSTLQPFSVASKVAAENAVFSTSHTNTCISRTDMWLERTTFRPSLPSWTRTFSNTTTPTSNSCHLNYLSSNGNTIKPSTTITWHGTSSQAPTSTVIVGAAGKLLFSPPAINASVGNIISFNFLGLNHTLTQSGFLNPCRSNGRFDTGFRQFNPGNTSGMFIVDYEVTTLEPQWFFCAQTLNNSHCHAGMVFSLNPGGLQNQYLQNAITKTATANMTSAPICHTPVLGVSSENYRPNIPLSTGLSTSNISSIGATPIANSPIVNGADANTVQASFLVLAYALFQFVE